MAGSDSEHSLDSEASMMLGSAYYRSAGQSTTTESVKRVGDLIQDLNRDVHPVWVLDQAPTAGTSMGLEPGSVYLQYEPGRHTAQHNHILQQQFNLQDAYDISRQNMTSGSIFDNVVHVQDGGFAAIELPADLAPVTNVKQEAPSIEPSSSSERLPDLEMQDRVPTNPRYKTKIACVHCAKNKLGCDLQRPCQRCRDTGKSNTCVDRPHVRRRRPQERHRRNAVVTDDNAVEEMESGAVQIRQSRTPYSRPEGQRYHLPTVQSAPAQLDQIDFTTFELYGTKYQPSE